MVKLLYYIQKLMIVMTRLLDILTCILVIELMKDNLKKMYNYQSEPLWMRIILKIRLIISKNMNMKVIQIQNQNKLIFNFFYFSNNKLLYK